MANAKTIALVAEIVRKDADRKYVVVSAPGKQHSKDTKITDLLYQLADEIINRNSATLFEPIRQRFLTIANELKLSFSMEDLLDYVLAQMLTVQTVDFIVSRGEYLSAKILADYLQYEYIDAADLIKFRGSKLDRVNTNKIARKLLKNRFNVVIGGFYGSSGSGDIKILSRGGSDISGALIARAVKAKIYENWTDVDGFLTCDPRIVEKPKLIEALTYKELRVLSFMGASVLHSEAVFPLIKEGIPINIRNTFNEPCQGTFIYPSVPGDKNKDAIVGIAGLKNFTMVIIEKEMMDEIIGFDRRILSICEKMGINVEHSPSGTDTFSLLIESKGLVNGKRELLLADIKKAVKPDNMEVHENISLISIVGRHFMANKNNMLKLFSALINANITLKMIDYGSNGIHIDIGVPDEDYNYAINAIYNEFVA